MWPMVKLNYSLNRHMEYVRQILYENPLFNLLVWACSGSPKNACSTDGVIPTNVQLWLKLPTVHGKEINCEETVEKEDKILELACRTPATLLALAGKKIGLDE